MSQFDLENDEVFAIVNEHHRRSNITRTVGVIVPMEEARQIAVHKATAKQEGSSIVGLVLPLAASLLAVTAGVLLLA